MCIADSGNKMPTLKKRTIAVDWGTSNFRAFLIGENATVVNQTESASGFLTVKDQDFASALKAILSAWIDNYYDYPIVMAGMVGSKHGWHEVDYVNTPCASAALVRSAKRFELPWGQPAFIIAGVKHDSDLQTDVMRGEEVQVLGLSELVNKSSLTAVLPGTHSKHIAIKDHQIQSLQTFMTGELYHLLVEHSILGKGITTTTNVDKDAFLKGVKEVIGTNITSSMFLARTHLLFERLVPSSIPDYLSGMLISHELLTHKHSHIFLVGSKKLTMRYQLACQSLGINCTCVDGNRCFVEGISRLNAYL